MGEKVEIKINKMAKQKKEESGLSESLKSAIEALNKSYGPGSVVGMGDMPTEVERVSTGSLILDKALSNGYPKNHIIEVYGPEGSGKSTLSLHFLAQFTGPKLLIDVEQSFSREYAEALGVDLKSTLICQPNSLEEAGDILITLLPEVQAVVFDSIAEATPKRELEGDMSTESTGVKAKKMSHLIRLIKGTKHNATIMFINQTRNKIGVVYGSPITTPGGDAIKFSTHVRIEISGQELIKRGEDIVGHYLLLKLKKNKLGTPHIKCRVPLIYDGFGVSKSQEILDLGIEMGILEQSGAWIRYNGTLVGQGVDKARQFLSDNPELRQELENKIRLLNNSSSNAK